MSTASVSDASVDSSSGLQPRGPGVALRAALEAARSRFLWKRYVALAVLVSPLVSVGFTLWLFLSYHVFASVAELVSVSALLVLRRQAVNVKELGLFLLVVARFLFTLIELRYLRYPSRFRQLFSGVLSTVVFSFILKNPEISSLVAGCAAFFSVVLWLSEFWVPTSRALARKSERKLLDSFNISSPIVDCSSSGISYIKVPYQDKDSGSKPVIVLAHGYAGGKSMYAPLMKDLSKHFEVYSIDWKGMGTSNRTFSWMITTPEECEDQFVESLEIWRRELDIDRFFLAGHSMGGYLSACYSLKYPHRVSRLYLASPIGVPLRERDPKEFFGPILSAIWDIGLPPQFYLKFFAPIGKWLFRKMVSKRWQKHIPRENAIPLGDYLFHVNVSPISGELVLPVLFHIGAFAKRPLLDRLKDMKCNTSFCYGEVDWMDRYAGLRASKMLREKGLDSRVYIIKGAGHQVSIEGKDSFVSSIINEMEVPSNTANVDKDVEFIQI